MTEHVSRPRGNDAFALQGAGAGPGPIAIGTLPAEVGMFDAVMFGAGGLICMTFGVWFVGRQHRRRASTRAGWGAMAIGLGQFFRAASSLSGSQQPLGFILTVCFAAFSLGGFILVMRDRDTLRRGSRKLPPLGP
ncbi:hypothetical protein [Streptomyces sp. P3]|uniref:hypothetical protein n=1 Tax=Streptomyces sp. P3 TaxID=2135430 RepID=UPI00131ED22B|nr:hypothetical protein [Streptomyces sp. P3]